MVFRDWEPAAEYFTDVHDVAADFYRPCMRDAIRYDRITGYFSSAIYLVVWAEIVDFAERGGKIRIICSPALSTGDARAMADAYQALTNEELAESVLADYNRLLQHPRLSEPARALAGLIVERVVDIRIAQVSLAAAASSRSMFHDKTGLFFDDHDDVIGFRGGINETYLGLATGGNVDSITVWTSWAQGREAQLTESNIERFERLWDNEAAGVDVREVPDVAMQELERIAEANDAWQITAEELAAREHIARESSPAARITLRQHQQDALAAWEHAGRIGLLKHATGAGKTLTAIEAIRYELHDGHRPLVLVPTVILLEQWTKELREQLGDLEIRVHPCSGEHTDWVKLLGAWLEPTEENRVVVSTISTAVNDRFLGQLQRAASRLLLVADEAHRLGASRAQRLLTVGAAARLGLSATPERAGDPDGTQALLAFFGGIVHTFTLQDALDTDPPILAKYAYEPKLVSLSDDEQRIWTELSDEIARLIARHQRDDELSHQALQHPEVKRRLIRRARVIKKAQAKIPLARSVVEEHFEEGQRWLVYCEDQEQLRDVVAELLDAHLPVTEYHAAMDGDRTATMDNFTANGGVLVSIRCLDEGVDIPNATHALILASSRNPREFIQRRGRVLRQARGKGFAEIYDAIVVPKPPLESSGQSMILGELARADEFAASSFTRVARDVLNDAYEAAGGNVGDRDTSGGFEVDDDEPAESVSNMEH